MKEKELERWKSSLGENFIYLYLRSNYLIIRRENLWNFKIVDFQGSNPLLATIQEINLRIFCNRVGQERATRESNI